MIRWRGFRCLGTWKAVESSFSRTLLDRGEAGRIDWECLAPRAACAMRLPGGGSLAGTGYVERMVLTIPPRELPIRELRWGRFHGPGETIVWIDWRAPESRTWIFRNGEEMASAAVNDCGLRFGDGNLSIENGPVLREGSLGSSALAGWPARPLLPRSVLALHETKKLSRARLSVPGTAPVVGVAIHEVVRWP